MSDTTDQRTVVLCRGLPGSGKTTFAKDWVAEDPTSRARVNRDDLRSSVYGTPTFATETEEERHRFFRQEELVTETQQTLVRGLLADGRDVVVDDTNLRPKYVREWERFAAAQGARTRVVEFTLDVEESVRRDAGRERPVGEDVIRRMASRYLPRGKFLPVPPADLVEPEADGEPDRYVRDPSLPSAIIVDIDGTVALKGDRGHYDLTKVGGDHPNWPVIEVVQAAHRDGLLVIYCSGREDSCLVETAKWITDYVDVPGRLLMRPTGDGRKDSIVKREIFDAFIRHHYNVRYVLDDRPQVIRMWASLGLTVLDVNPMSGEF